MSFEFEIEAKSTTVRQEILTKQKFDEFDESFVSSIFNSSNFYRIMLGLSQSKHFVNI